MNNHGKQWLPLFVFICILMILVSGCNKKQSEHVALVPTVKTYEAANITSNSVQSGGICTDNGAGIIQKGVCWSVSPSPTTEANKTADSGGAGEYVSFLTGLMPSTLYYFRAYATNSIGTGYGDELTFKTVAPLSLKTLRVTDINATMAKCGGIILTDGGNPVEARGLCWSKLPGPTLLNDHSLDGSGTGEYVSEMHDLLQNTRYYARAYATTVAGTSYGNEVNFDNTYYIGAKYGGGTIFYIDNTDAHGLIAANNDQSASNGWGCEGVPVPGTLAQIGSGQANTNAIIQKCSTGQTAARVCDELILNGYSDWFLPSKDELNEMYVHKEAIGGFSITAYWSSTEYKSEAPYGMLAWLQWFNTGDQFYSLKGNDCYVRAIRAF